MTTFTHLFLGEHVLCYSFSLWTTDGLCSAQCSFQVNGSPVELLQPDILRAKVRCSLSRLL
jgi:hypothetical protein